MTSVDADFLKRWSKLGRLGASPIDLDRIDLIRALPAARLSHAADLDELVPRLGLNDEGLREFPPHLHPYCGQGLLIWQYPNQFGPYLACLSTLGIRSYLEIGVRHGGTFVATVECLERACPLDFAVAVDVLPCPSMAAYRAVNEKAVFHRLNTQSADYRDMLASYGRFDLVLVDSLHEEAQCRNEVRSVIDRADMIALHDACSADYPGVGVVWREIKADSQWVCREFFDQYPGSARPFMGIGLAIRKERMKGHER